MKKVRTAIFAGITAMALSFSACSNLISDVSNESTITSSALASRSVIVEESVPIDSSIAVPFGLVADVGEKNLIRLAWGCPSVKPDLWYIYLDGQKVDETSILKQVEIECYAGNHVVAVAAVKNGRRSEAEGIEVSVREKLWTTTTGRQRLEQIFISGAMETIRQTSSGSCARTLTEPGKS